ncbi:hypothetical protein, partial [Clostridioides difficile]|uniref:hypothetical protein n=1 Tax=Clostridioides difficile TaxID=1496 RepID=UPI003F761FDA
SQIGVNTIINNQGFLNIVISSSTAMSAIAGSSTAMSAIAGSSTAMSAIAGSSTAMSVICKSQNASIAIAEKIQSYRTRVISTLSNTGFFSKKTLTIGDGSGTFTDGINTNTFYIPINCYDDNDTDYTVYYGCKDTLSIVTSSRHSNTVTLSQGVSLRGTKVVGVGSSRGNVGFDVYTAI